MAKVLRTVAVIAGTIALAATGVGAIAGPTLLASINAAVGASVTTIASVASVVSASAGLGSQLLAKAPPAQGNVNQVTIGANQPIPYGMGRSFFAGSQLHEMGYGGEVDDVDNPYRSHVLAWSGGGPVEEIESFLLDWQAVTFSSGEATGYYAEFLFLDTQLGARPESTALAGPWGDFTGWSSSSKLSGYAAGLVSFKFDKKGKRWANGIPAIGAVGKWARVYDWRLDSTFPGGSGSHRWDDEDSWEWDPNVALNAIAYARGRFTADTAGVMTVGCGFPFGSIDWPAWTAFANLCDANGWEVNGHVFDGPGISRWDNLKRICEAAGAKPCFTGGLLSVQIPAPVASLDTVTRDDLADGEHVVPVMRTFRERVNTVVPKYRSEANRWEMVQSAAISEAAFVSEDGEPKELEWPLELVTDKDQAAEIGGYVLWNGRERDGITLRCKPRLWEYRLGEALELDLPEFGLEGDHVITAVDRDAGSATVTLTFMTEDPDKHTAALGQTGTAPPSPGLPAHGDSDDVVGDNAVVVTAGALDAITDVHGSLLFRGEDVWEGLGPGTAGQLLASGGADADPAWASAGWETVGTWDFDTNGATSAIVATGLEVFDEIRVFARDVTKSDNVTLVLHVSTDGGSSYYDTSGDYATVDSAGNEGAVGQPRLHATNATAARTGWATIQFNGRLPALPIIASNGDASPRLFVADTDNPIDALRVVPNGLAGTLTGGAITVEGRRAI